MELSLCLRVMELFGIGMVVRPQLIVRRVVSGGCVLACVTVPEVSAEVSGSAVARLEKVIGSLSEAEFVNVRVNNYSLENAILTVRG
jgi:hypothetical protein